jgi:hypothetical protein
LFHYGDVVAPDGCELALAPPRQRVWDPQRLFCRVVLSFQGPRGKENPPRAGPGNLLPTPYAVNVDFLLFFRVFRAKTCSQVGDIGQADRHRARFRQDAPDRHAGRDGRLPVRAPRWATTLGGRSRRLRSLRGSRSGRPEPHDGLPARPGVMAVPFV